MKNLLKIICSTAIYIALNQPLTFAQSSVGFSLQITAYQQEQSQWCWAGCTRMVDWAYSTTTPPSQCSIVNKANDQCDGWFNICCSSLNGSRPSACATPLSSNYPNSMYGCNGSLSWLVNYYAGANTSYGSALGSSTVITSISNRRMMIARWGWTSGGGHFVVIYGYKSTTGLPLTISYANPGSGSKVTENFTYFTSNASRTWTHTLRMDNSSIKRFGDQTDATQVIDLGESMRVYPNPSNGEINLERFDNITQSAEVSISNTWGQIVFKTTIHAFEPKITLDLKNKAGSGLYFLNLIEEEKQSTKKIMIR